MANIDVLTPQQLSSGYLHPILLAFLNSLPNPNIVIQQHPAFPILAQTHPNTNIVASLGSMAPGFNDPAQALTSASGVETTGTAPRVDSTRSSGTQIASENAGPPLGSSGGSASGTLGTGGGPNTTGRSSGSQIFGGNSPSPTNTPPTPGIPTPRTPGTGVQPAPKMGPNASPPIGNTSALPVNPPSTVAPQFSTSGPSGIPVTGAGSAFNAQPPISGANPLNQNTSGVVAGPQALNHVPYGPELTGLSGFGGLITPNGTPVAMSAWQKLALDPTSIARYNSYVSDVAGMNPADLAQIGQAETANKMADLKAPIKFAGIEPIAAPAGG